MAVRLRLARHGAKKTPFYRIVAADGRAPRDGRFLEVVGTYDPMTEPAEVRLKQERIEYWVGVGATPTDTVKSLLRRARRTPDTVTFLDGTAAAAPAKPKAKAKAKKPAAPVAKAAAPVEAAPVEAAPVVEAPVVEAPVVEAAAPVVEAAPAVEEAPAVEAAPAVEEAPAADEAPAEEAE